MPNLLLEYGGYIIRGETENLKKNKREKSSV
jgi:hypothetical protein